MKTMMRIVLVGFMGCGKSAVGRVLADRLGGRFVDLDEAIMAAFGMPVREIFDLHGEEAFRREESRLLEVALAEAPVVVAAGGGAFCREANRRLIHEAHGLAVFLDVPWEVLEERLRGQVSDRPKFESPASARRLFDSRYPAYASADFRLELTGREPPRAVAAQLCEEAPVVS